MKIIIVDDNPQFRESLEIFIRLKLGYDVLATYNSAEDFLAADMAIKSDVILMDIELPGQNGIKATATLLQKHEKLKVIAVTNYHEKAYLSALIAAGFKACVLKNNIFEELNKAIKRVINGELFFPTHILI